MGIKGALYSHHEPVGSALRSSVQDGGFNLSACDDRCKCVPFPIIFHEFTKDGCRNEHVQSPGNYLIYQINYLISRASLDFDGQVGSRAALHNALQFRPEGK